MVPVVRLPSVYHSDRKPYYPNLLASIFFAFDRAELDHSAHQALDVLVKLHKPILDRHRVILSFIGYADQIDSDEYNIDLGKRRANAVRDYVGRHLGSYANYSGAEALSYGEKYAHQGRATQEQMAYDRRVEVHQTKWSPRPPVVQVVHPMVTRTISRSFSKFATENLMRPDLQGDDIGRGAFKDAVDTIPAIVKGKLGRFEYTWGDENKAQRKSAFFKADQRVTRVVMNLRYKYEIDGSALLHYWDATIDYTWGPPAASVTVLEIKKIIHFSEKRSITQVPRAEADDDPLYTPPDP